MRVLHLTLKKKWFDMIASGEKKEEYREIKKYWLARLCETRNILDGFKDYDYIHFSNGYNRTARKLNVEVANIDVGYGRPEWGAEEGKEYFVIKLGELLKR